MEKLDSLKFVKGEVAYGKPADIYFYDDVEYWDVRQFVREFQYLVDYVEVSKIRVHIHSVGGSCHEGIKAFSTILNSSVPTETYNDGLAASMASIIWAAGKERFMRDYAVLMIHNPWVENDTKDPNDKIIIETFKKQLQLIYQSRFHLDEESVKAILDGEEGIDGTWLFAQDAINAGIIDEQHIIASSDTVAAKIAASIEGVKDLKVISEVMSKELHKGNQKPVQATITDKNENNHVSNNKNNFTMTENEIKMVAAQLGFAEGNATGAEITNKVNALIEAGKQFDSVKAEVKALKDSITAKDTEITGLKASVENLNKNLEAANAQLKVYKEAEEAEKQAKINAMVEAAVKDGRIKAEAKETWVNLASKDFDLAKTTLDAISPVDNISSQINSDPANIQAAQQGRKSEEEKAEERVLAVIGKDFKYRTPGF